MKSAMASVPRDLRERLTALECDIDAGRYQGGVWQTLLRDIRRLSQPERVTTAQAVSRLSDKLHARTAKRQVAFGVGLVAEVGLALLGAVLLFFAVQSRSSGAAIATALLWTMAFQPLTKILTGTVLGIRYSYAYLLGPELRFKMRYGTYIAAPRFRRIILHLSGTIGSPFGAWLPTAFLGSELPAATTFCWMLFDIAVAINVVPFVIALIGVQRIGPLRPSWTSGASAVLEIREGLHAGR